ncbi:MAG: DUF58 domain-containing protein [Planctomycetota bacterium]|jgi:uncharacterized protein (DUF58 family)
MLTPRARLLLVLAVAGSITGLMRAQELLTLSSMSVLIWLLLEWTAFRIRADHVAPKLVCHRTINGSGSANGTLWTGRATEIETTIALNGWISLPHVLCREILPENLQVSSGHTAAAGAISPGHPIRLCFDAEIPGAGRVEFRGVNVRLSDRFGLFVADRFIAAHHTFRVLPTGISPEPGHPVTKRLNTQMPPGIHRLQRPGTGSELLEIRDYIPGDPPKSIAWKVSARRGSLMTREYESEVPVRTWLYVDASYRARAGSFGLRPIDQLLFCAGSIAQSALSVRDPVGLVTFRETGIQRVASGQGSRHYFQLLDAMAAAACANNPPPSVYSKELLDFAWQVCNERHPELIDQRYNPNTRRFWPLSRSRRLELNRRSRLAAVLVEFYGLPFEMTFRLERDELMLTNWLQRFLIEQGCAWTWPVIERRSRELHDWDGKFDTLTHELSRAILHGRDNELFVLLLDLIDYSGPLMRLEKVIRLARAKHHRVSVICSWPDSSQISTEIAEESLARKQNSAIAEQLMRAERLRISSSAQRLRRELRRCGASVSFATDPASIHATLAEADLARFGRVTHVRSGR